jgi:glycosyltransferase involved in cell wall biosynthesis
VKDYPSFLRAAKLLGDRVPRTVFLCVGDGPKQVRSDLVTLGRQLGLESSLIWTGDRDDVVALFNAMDVAVSNSISEGFPNVVAEAMACGVPCVVTDVGDSALVVGTTGRVIPAGDPAALSAAIDDLLEAAPDHIECRRRIARLFSLEKMVASTEDALLQVCSSPEEKPGGGRPGKENEKRRRQAGPPSPRGRSVS